MGTTSRRFLPHATLVAVVASLACAPATQSGTGTPGQLASGPVRHHYRYSAVIDRRYDLASIGLPLGSRELQAVSDWWVSVTLEPVTPDSFRLQATIDSAAVRLSKKIPEVSLNVPPTLGQGGHVEGTTARHGGGVGLRAATPADSALLTILPMIVPQLAAVPAPSDVVTGDASADTTYATRRSRRAVSKASAGPPNFSEIVARFRMNSGILKLLGEEMSEIEGTTTQYFDRNGILLGTRFQRRMTTATKVVAQGAEVTIAGNGVDAIRIDLVP